MPCQIERVELNSLLYSRPPDPIHLALPWILFPILDPVPALLRSVMRLKACYVLDSSEIDPAGTIVSASRS